ncbi:uncharacterized protein ACR2FA_009421 [Aphomia sociella]
MKTLIFIVVLLVVTWLGSTSPINPKRRLINRPIDIFRHKRSSQYVKGGRPDVKGGHHSTTPPALRKGEYVCGDRICKLRPGEIPRNCNGCQYRIA